MQWAVQGTRYKRTHTVSVHFYQVQEQAKLISGKISSAEGIVVAPRGQWHCLGRDPGSLLRQGKGSISTWAPVTQACAYVIPHLAVHLVYIKWMLVYISVLHLDWKKMQHIASRCLLSFNCKIKKTVAHENLQQLHMSTLSLTSENSSLVSTSKKSLLDRNNRLLCRRNY